MSLLVSVPLFRGSLAVESYLLRCEDQNDGVLDTLTRQGIATFSAAQPLAVPFSGRKLEEQPVLYPYGTPSQLIPLLPEGVRSEHATHLRRQGYQLMTEGLEPDPPNLADFWIADWHSLPGSTRKAVVRRMNRSKVSVIAGGLRTRAEFQRAEEEGFQLYVGSFFCEPLLERESDINPIKSNLIRLLNIVRSQNYEFSTVSNVVRQDPALTINLMRFINSPYIGLRNRVHSIQQAVALLGQDEVRKWVMAAVFKSLGTDRPGELTRISLVRAKFAENLSPLFHMAVQSDTLFLIGLFSVLDVILGVPMEQALELVPFSEEVHKTLMEGQGRFAPVLTLIQLYEGAQWEKIRGICQTVGQDTASIANCYLEALAWYNDLISRQIKPVRER